ncbi:MAG TPA: SPOR domain-containing protein [Candidatus Limnocylindrales bacterium]|nr:SPOR domain-containing protein [Candidatus Limnocylindrales bacterium]
METGPFGLLRNPFQRSAELDDGCLPNAMAAVLSELQSGLSAPRGVGVLVGERGAGKSLAAASFARRLGAVARVALLVQPTSSVSAIARDALMQIDPSDFDFAIDEDWVRALHANAERRGRAGSTTAIVIDDAHRLSPQTLSDLVKLFGEEDPLRLHIFLFGRPRLLEHIEAGGDDALGAHLLQICRLETLTVRESVRYLERRIAICGGELAALFTDDAIDEIVRRSEGRLMALEEVAGGALRRAAKRGSKRIVAEDVMAVMPRAIAEEDRSMANRQQPINFRISDDVRADASEAVDEWTDDEDEETVEWGEVGDQDEDADELWQTEAEAEDDELPEASALSWDTAPHRLGQDRALDDDASYEAIFAGRAAAGARAAKQKPAARKQMAGRAVLSLAACLGLVWAANHLPSPASESRHGRDAKLFAEPLSTKPEQILRLASTIEEADADAQVVAWRQQPPPAPAAVTAKAASAAAPVAESHATVADYGRDATAQAATGPQLDPARAASRAVDAKEKSAGASAKDAGKTVATASAPKQLPAVASAKTATAKATPAVFTVQLGAFKTRSNAEEMVTKLRGKPTRILQEGGLYRVMSGSFANRHEATAHEAALKRAGYTTFIRTASF